MPYTSRVNQEYDAVVIGSGPNGLSAAITIAKTGRSVLVLEGRDSIGGGTRTSELTLPGFRHDVCAAIHTIGVSSPFFTSIPLARYGLEWVFSPVETVHPLEDGRSVLLHRSVERTAAGLGGDGAAYRRVFNPLVKNFQKIIQDLLGPFPLPPRHPLALLGFGVYAIRSALGLAKSLFKEEPASALFAGFGGHSIQPLENWSTAGVALTLMMSAHAGGMPMVKGGTQQLANAMVDYLKSMGGQVVTNMLVDDFYQLPKARIYLFDTSPGQLVKICGGMLPEAYKRSLSRYRYGAGVYKVDYAMEAPIPWKAEDCLKAATVHIGGNQEEIAQAEREVWQGIHPENPYILLTQTSLFDPGRAPTGKHTAWAYCHVPNNSTFDMSERIEAQIERFAPGFRQRILARHTFNSLEMESYNPNYVGGDIVGGVQDLSQLFFRPTVSLKPYRTPIKGIYLCSASTPPGGAVHGMSGYHAARIALRDIYK